MALDFIFANKAKASFDGIKLISFDASLTESHVRNASVTQNPVESGANISDNISILPVTLSITGFVTDSPVKILQGVRDLVNGSGSYVATAHEDLLTLFNSKTPFKVVTGLETYENMVLTGLTFPRDAKTGRSITFKCQLTEIITATFDSETLTVENVSEDLDTKQQAGSKVEKGKQNTTASTPEQDSYRSGLHSILF